MKRGPAIIKTTIQNVLIVSVLMVFPIGCEAMKGEVTRTEFSGLSRRVDTLEDVVIGQRTREVTGKPPISVAQPPATAAPNTPPPVLSAPSAPQRQGAPTAAPTAMTTAPMTTAPMTTAPMTTAAMTTAAERNIY
ncbi:MAG: hypothetical protein ACRCTY_08560, partial [Candidatus Adiutrix sp.]